MREQGLRVHIDTREKTPGNKFFDWELKGVPVRIEIGPRDVEQRGVTLVTRDGKKKQIGFDYLQQVGEELTAFDRRITERAEQFLQNNLHTLQEAEKKKGIIEVPWCGQEMCGLAMEEKVDMTSLGIPYDKKDVEGKCAICGNNAVHWLRLAKTY